MLIELYPGLIINSQSIQEVAFIAGDENESVTKIWFTAYSPKTDVPYLASFEYGQNHGALTEQHVYNYYIRLKDMLSVNVLKLHQIHKNAADTMLKERFDRCPTKKT